MMNSEEIRRCECANLCCANELPGKQICKVIWENFNEQVFCVEIYLLNPAML